MPNITAPNITTEQILYFGLIGNTPSGDQFVEPTVAVEPSTAGSVTLQPSVQGQGGAFTTQGAFVPASGYIGPVTLQGEVQGVDDQDVDFEVITVPQPETVSFDTTKFVVAANSPAPVTGSSGPASTSGAPAAPAPSAS